MLIAATFGFNLAECPATVCPRVPVGDIRQEQMEKQLDGKRVHAPTVALFCGRASPVQKPHDQ